MMFSDEAKVLFWWWQTFSTEMINNPFSFTLQNLTILVIVLMTDMIINSQGKRGGEEVIPIIMIMGVVVTMTKQWMFRDPFFPHFQNLNVWGNFFRMIFYNSSNWNSFWDRCFHFCLFKFDTEMKEIICLATKKNLYLEFVILPEKSFLEKRNQLLVGGFTDHLSHWETFQSSPLW